MGDNELQTQIQDVRNEVGNLKTGLADVRAEIRITKHDVANTQQMLIGLSTSQEKIGEKIDSIKDQLAGLNVKHEKGVSFFAGIAFVVAMPIALIVTLIKLLPSG